MVEPASAAAAAKAWDIGFLGLSELVKRIDLVEDNKEKLPELSEMYDNVLKEVDDLVKHDVFHDIAICNQNVKSRLQDYKKRLQNNRDKVRALENEVKSTKVWECWKRVEKPRKVMEECRAVTTEFRGYYDASVRPALERTAEAKAARERTNLERAQERTAVVFSSEPDSYVVRSNVPPNPPRLTLDYTTENTCEGRLKAEILRSLQSSSRIVGVVASGLGGVGKTCALRGLAREEDVKRKFPDGILYISLGNDSHVSDMISEIAWAVEITGGVRLANAVRAVGKVQEACNKAARWFKPHKCLFLVDDIWWVNGITSDVFGDLGIMLHRESILVYTTRDKRFLRGADKVVSFEARATHGQITEHMLLTHAGFGTDTELCSENRKAFDGILDICKGLPLAIGIAGATVKKYYDRRERNKQDAWVDYCRNLISKEENIIGESADRYGKVRLMVDSSLDVLKTSSGFTKSFEEMFRGFCVVRKQQKVSGQVLQRLWNLGELREAREVAERFDEVCLVQMTGSWNKFYVQLHDLVLDIAMRNASDRYEVTQWFGTLVDNYMPKRRRANTEVASDEAEVAQYNPRSRHSRKGFSCLMALAKRCFTSEENDAQGNTGEIEKGYTFRPWWNVEDDGFIHDNVCRILQGAGESKELLWLLERAQWVVMRLQKVGISRVEQDLAIGRKVSEKDKSNETAIGRYLKLVGSAARLSFAAVNENAYEAWFQMYGRMVWYAKHCERTQIFLSEIEEHAPRPWVKPSVGILEEAGGAASETVQIGNWYHILCISHGGGVVSILWTDGGHAYVTEYYKIDGSQKVQRLDLNDLADASSLGHHADNSDGQRSSSTMSISCTECTCGAFSDDQKRVVIGYSDGRIVVRNADSGYKLENCFESPDYLEVIAISGDGRTIVSASNRDYVRVWDASSENAVGNQVVGHWEQADTQCLAVSFDGNVIVSVSEGGRDSDYSNESSSIRIWDRKMGEMMTMLPEVRDDYVLCATVSRDGRRFVSGSGDGVIRVWKLGSAETPVLTIQGHTWAVKSVALSADGNRLVSSSEDGTVFVWNTETGEKIEPFEGYARHGERVGVSADGHEVVTEVSDGSVRVWSVENADTADVPDRYRGRVWCVAYCGRGSKVVSGSADGCVRLWDGESGDRIGQPLAAHTGKEVVCVAVSADANRIVSASRDGTVRVWDANSGEAVAEHLSSARGFGIVAVNDDGTRVVFCFEEWVDVWDVDSDGVTTVTRDAWLRTCVAISADGARIAFCPSGHSVVVWDVHARQQVGSPLEGHTDEVRSLAFSGDGKRLESGSGDRTVRVWDVASGGAIGHPFVHHCEVVHVQSDVGGAMVASYDERGYGRLWDVKLGKCVLTSSDPTWTSTLHRLEVARLQWHPRVFPTTEIVASTSAEHQQVLASIDDTDRGIAPVGDVYFSQKHGSSFWPFCKLVK
ncbi:hypothetical protein BWQ96_08860 [Gracilariopsis chorda]|uniref:NB-ARC domain-containing protein n=1 Tax=Gracilariopsis chorda TaxID=448386 RepID=A0A2V3IH58_9FLOR|nr:hypothetical protein BWQ96_08860 [Gracilariopsis chorda]|eukprot:PXF41425.1 hypothetical protein BWQ96_08860 [Gracilariopsis chorda]